MKLLALILLPYIAIWAVTKNRLTLLRWPAIFAVLSVQLLAILPIGAAAYSVYSDGKETAVSGNVRLGQIYTAYNASQATLHGLDGWKGVDITSGCGSAILAPFDGRVTYRGLDGYNHVDERGVVWEQATMLTIQGKGGIELTLLHGDYSVQIGDQVLQGQPVGREASNGWSTGCHSHVILKQNGQTLNFLTWKPQTMTASAKRPSGIPTASKPLKISWYDPLLGGINCDSDCTTMASGTKVTEALYGNAAACVRAWMGKTVVIEGLGEFTCRDTGGAIVEHPGYIYIDLLLHQPFQDAPFGTLIYEWELK